MGLPFKQMLHAGNDTGGIVGKWVGATGAGGPIVGTGAGVGSKGHPQVPAANACAVKHSFRVKKLARPAASACWHVMGNKPARAMVVGFGSGILPPSLQMLQKIVGSSVGIGVMTDGAEDEV